MADAQVLCGYCGEPLENEAALDDHLDECAKRPSWLPRHGKRDNPLPDAA